MSNDFWQTIGDFVAAEMRGAEQERERIIKLLEDNNKLCTEKTVCFDADDGWLCNCKELFALIKGEQK
jgi:hypothetical protein